MLASIHTLWYAVPMNLGTLLAHHRGRRTQAAVAEAIGITDRTLGAIERGMVPTGRTLAKLLRYYCDTEPALTGAQRAELFDALIAMADHRSPPDHRARPWTREHQRDLWHFEIDGSVMRCGLVIAGSPIVATEIDAATRPKCDRCLGAA